MYFSKQVSTNNVQLDQNLVSLDSVLIKKISGLQFVKGVVPPSCSYPQVEKLMGPKPVGWL